MHGRARAPAGGTVVNALATHQGSAFAIDAHIHAEVTLTESGPVSGTVGNDPDADTRLIERAVELVVSRFGDGQGGEVRTETDVPMAGGLKSSSAAANATVLATLEALDVSVGPLHDDAIDREAAARIGVDAARGAGVTITGAFDDASASMLGGVTVTDNDADELLDHRPLDTDVLVWMPPEQSFSADADVDRCRQIAPMADHAIDLALAGDYGTAMTVNGFAYCAALDYPTGPVLDVLPAVRGVSLSGTGPSYVAIGSRETLESVRAHWSDRSGTTWLTTTDNDGAQISTDETSPS